MARSRLEVRFRWYELRSVELFFYAGNRTLLTMEVKRTLEGGRSKMRVIVTDYAGEPAQQQSGATEPFFELRTSEELARFPSFSEPLYAPQSGFPRLSGEPPSDQHFGSSF